MTDNEHDQLLAFIEAYVKPCSERMSGCKTIDLIADAIRSSYKNKGREETDKLIHKALKNF